MKASSTLLCCCAFSAVAFADENPATGDFKALSATSMQRLSGSLTLGYDTLGNGRGIVLSHSAVEGDGSPFGALKLNYDFGEKGGWSYDTIVAYRDSTSGHTLYGNPYYNCHDQVYAVAYPQYYAGAIAQGYPSSVAQAYANQKANEYYDRHYRGKHIKEANCEPEIAFINNFRYTQNMWNVAFGHDVIHGGIIGVMAKHFRNQGASCVNEFFVRPELTPYKWANAGMTIRYSVAGIDGWWFEPDITFKAPVIGTEDNVKLAAVMKLGMSATLNYFNHTDSACGNGSQAYYIRFMAPWYATERFIVTPGFSLHWLGRGAVKCNEKSRFKMPTQNSTFVPFRNFAVMGTIMVTYKF